MKPVIEELKINLRGDLVSSEDDAYDEARAVYNGMIDKYPALIAYCDNTADVMTAVNFGREQDMLVSIRGGGHNAGGLGICDDGLVIDLSRINNVFVDPKTKTARVGGGATLGDLDHATHGFGLATPGGIISTTGVGGLTLGGGLGYLTRKCGLTIDNLLSADMVLADGSFATASSEENEDLFWAIRGGGGNFGVVTSFEFQLHDIKTVYAGPIFWELDEARDVMEWYRDFILEAPDDMYGFFAFLVVPPGPPFPEHLHNKNVCGVVWCYTGPMDKAEESFKPIREFGSVILDLAGPIPYPALQSMFDELYPPGLQWYWKADFVTELPDEAINVHLEYGASVPSMHSTMHLYPINGAAHAVDSDETAWDYREATWAQVMVGVDPDPSNRGKITDWAKDYWEKLHPYSAGGAYINFMMDEGEERVKATYRDNYKRLAKIKAKYDPDNFFRVNQNIKPVREEA